MLWIICTDSFVHAFLRDAPTTAHGPVSGSSGASIASAPVDTGSFFLVFSKDVDCRLSICFAADASSRKRHCVRGKFFLSPSHRVTPSLLGPLPPLSRPVTVHQPTTKYVEQYAPRGPPTRKARWLPEQDTVIVSCSTGPAISATSARDNAMDSRRGIAGEAAASVEARPSDPCGRSHSPRFR